MGCQLHLYHTPETDLTGTKEQKHQPRNPIKAKPFDFMNGVVDQGDHNALCPSWRKLVFLFPGLPHAVRAGALFRKRARESSRFFLQGG